MRWGLILVCCWLIMGCVTSPPRQADNICDIFAEKRGWYRKANRAAERWDSNVPMIMAFMFQESSFIGNARPPRGKFLWIFPGRRPSSAYGYSQAKRSTWRWYQEDTGQRRARRTRFGDAADFIGWYNKKSSTMARISTHDSYNLYLAYHEGQGGFRRGTYQNKPWLKGVAQRVAARTQRYQRQLQACEADLKKRRWLFF